MMQMMGMRQGMGGASVASNIDRHFIEQMIPHHQMAVMMAQMFLSGSNRSEMKKLAQDIIDAQKAEIEQMRSWFQE